MGTNDFISATCDCGRTVKAPSHLAGKGIKCPVCGAMVLLSEQPRDISGPPCPHCGKPWPATHAHCPSCMARSRKRSGPPKEAVSRIYTDLSGLDSDSGLEVEEDATPEHPDLEAFSHPHEDGAADLDLDELQQDESELPQLKSIRFKSGAVNIGWKCASIVSGIFAVICLATAASNASGLWGICGLIYLLCTAGLFFGIPVSKKVFIGSTLLLVAAYLVWNMVNFYTQVSIASAAVLFITTLVTVFGFNTICFDRAKGLNYVYVGGGICAIGVLGMALSFSSVVTPPMEGTKGGMEQLVENISEKVSERGNSSNTNTKSSSISNTNNFNEYSGTRNEIDNDPNDVGNSDQSAEGQSSSTEYTSKYSLSRIQAEQKKKHEAELAAQREIDSSIPSWLANLRNIGIDPQFPAGTSASVRKKKIALSPVYGSVSAEMVYCNIAELYCSVWITDELPESLQDQDMDKRKILEAVSRVESEYFINRLPLNLEMKNEDIQRNNDNYVYLARFTAPAQAHSYMGLLNAQIAGNKIIIAMTSFDRKSARNNKISKEFLQSMKISQDLLQQDQDEAESSATEQPE